METQTQNKSILLTNVGNAIKKYRLEANLSQPDLSLITGISVKYISDIEGGKRNLSLTVLARIAEGLNVNILDLLDISYRSSKDRIKNEIGSLLNDFSVKELETVRQLILTLIRDHPDL